MDNLLKDLLNRQFTLIELFPFAWSIIIKIISFIFQYRYSLSLARGLDLNVAAKDLNDSTLVDKAEVAAEANTRFTLFLTLLTSGLSAIIITAKNGKVEIGVIFAAFLILGTIIFQFLEKTHFNTKYFTKKGNAWIVLLIFIATDIILLGATIYSAPE